ncbi:hypothetical protein CRUP_027729 [Coryphaenoides rupestris]|nr:hypothetical protein CRUP_027729 [Coryphaenoides rupestris]
MWGEQGVLVMEEEARMNGACPPGRRGSDWGRIALLDKNKEFFQICDLEAKGFITRTDMRLPLSAEELEDVFDSLDTGRDGYLTLEAFSSGFSQFLHGRRFSLADDLSPTTPAPAPGLRVKETLYQSQWEAKLAGGGDEEEEQHFCMLMESLGASNVFEDPGEMRSLWAQLRKDEPHLLSNFEEFLARVTSQIKEAKQDKKEMESALQRKAATHDTEIRHLYEEMEAQIKNEKDRLHLKDSERHHLHSQDLEHQLPRSSLRNKQKQQKAGLANLFDDPSQPTNSSEAVVDRCYQSLEALPLHHLQIVFVASSSCSEDDTTPASTSTPASASCNAPSLSSAPTAAASANSSTARASIAPVCPQQQQQQRSPTRKKTSGGLLANGYADRKSAKMGQGSRVKRAPGRAGAAAKRGAHHHHRERERERGGGRRTRTKEEEEEEGLDAPPDGWPLRRVKEGVATVPERLFKVVLSHAGSLRGLAHIVLQLRSRIDYSVKTLTLDNTQVAMQLWDTAGQERY